MNLTSRRSIFRITLIFTAVLTLGGGWFGVNSRAATETPEYEVMREEGDFEIRSYPALKLVSTSMPGREMDGSFMKLFRFIDGNNTSQEKVAMTSPVLIEKNDERSTMSFIVPKATVSKGVPEPSAEDVALGELPALRVLAMRFRGRSNNQLEEAAEARIRAWAQEQGLAVSGDVLFAYYDPPWTPSFMRRNEVMLRLDKAPAKKPDKP